MKKKGENKIDKFALKKLMSDSTDIKVEQIGGLPIVLQVLSDLKLGEKLDEHFRTHGNWEGASKGFIVCIWISYIILTCDHRLSSLEEWVEERQKSLEQLTGKSIRIKDFTDDKLGKLLDDFSDGEQWAAFETVINRSFIRIYGFSEEVIQIDPTIGKSFRKVVEDGLFQYGHSKHFRKDLPQFKTVLANLADGSFPLSSMTVSGEQADDGLYIPIMEQAKKSLDKNGLLWVGDTKISALGTRAYVVGNKDYYLAPLSKVQLPEEVLRTQYVEPVLEGREELKLIKRQGKVIAKGYEGQVTQSFEGRDLEKQQWEERHLVIRSEQYAQAQQRGLLKRLNKTREELLALNVRKQGKKTYSTEEELEKVVEQIQQKYKVKGLLEVAFNIHYEEKPIRSYKGKAARVEKKMHYSLTAQIKQDAFEQKVSTLGWRVYVTNKGADELSLEDAVLLYREEYKIERRIRNLKEEVTRLLPVFLKKENRIIGLINLLILVLKVIAAIEFKVAKELEQRGEELGEIYAGNPKITTARPTISKMMNAFKSFAIVFWAQNDSAPQILIPELKPVQRKIIDLLDLDLELFQKLKPKKAIQFSQ